jgi:hypothetical protein
MYELRKSRPVAFRICANAGISEPCTITSLARSRNPPHRRGGPNSRQPAMHSRTLQHRLQLGDVRRVAWLSLITRAPPFVRDPDCPASRYEDVTRQADATTAAPSVLLARPRAAP